MAFPTIFANLAAGYQPASLLDQMFNICGGMGNIPCTATGVNAITLTPVVSYYQPAAYANYQLVSFRAAASTTGAATIALGALGFVKLFMPSGLQATSGDITAGTKVLAMFAADLDGGSGGFIVMNASTPSVIQPVQGVAKMLAIGNFSGSPDTTMQITAAEVMLENASGGAAKVTGVNAIANSAVNGANGLDTGILAAATWYALFVIYNPTTTGIGGLLSLSATSPVMPPGYTYRARVGYIRTGPASTNFHRITQIGRKAQYVVTPGSQTPALPVIANGFGAAWTAQAIGNFVAPTAACIRLQMTASGTGNNTTQVALVAPNASYGTAVTVSPYPPMAFTFFASTGEAVNAGCNQTAEMVIESSNVFTGQSGTWSSGNPVLSCMGWEDIL